MTITQQQIIDLAVEAGMHIAPNGTVHASQSELETLVYAAVAKETQARIKLQKEFVEYRNDMQARGTRLIKEAYQRGVRDEREACAKLVESEACGGSAFNSAANYMAGRIRARSKEST